MQPNQADRRPPRLRDVAERAGVSVGLVSRVLNGDRTARLRPETKEAVMRAAAELSYVPNSAARSLRYSRTGTLGMVLESVTSPMYDGIVHGAQRAAATHGYFTLAIDAHEVERRPQRFSELVSAGRVDGILLQGGFDQAQADLIERVRPLPAVIINAFGDGNIPGIVLQDEKAAEIGTDHLIELGHRDLLFVGADSGTSSDRRHIGFRTAIDAAGSGVNGRLVSGGWSAQACHDALIDFLADQPPPTAIVVVNAETAVGVLSALHERGLRVPEDVSVVAIHDSWFTSHLVPPLTTVWLPMEGLGSRAVERLLDQMTAPSTEDVIITDPPPHLELRASTAPAR